MSHDRVHGGHIITPLNTSEGGGGSAHHFTHCLQISVKFTNEVFLAPTRTTWGGFITSFFFWPPTILGFFCLIILNTRSNSYTERERGREGGGGRGEGGEREGRKKGKGGSPKGTKGEGKSAEREREREREREKERERERQKEKERERERMVSGSTIS